jgi:hypothetical protein
MNMKILSLTLIGFLTGYTIHAEHYVAPASTNDSTVQLGTRVWITIWFAPGKRGKMNT